MINLSIPQGDVSLQPRITVVGVGGAGGNAVNNMIRANLQGVEFVVANTDAQALSGSEAAKKLQLGLNLTQGLGAGSRPDIGRAAAEEQIDEITAYLEGSHMVFITAGMGGGTGTGAAPVIARAAREQGVLTVGVVTKPFHFEGAHRMRTAEQGLAELQQYVDTLIIIPNQNLFRIANERTTFAEAFRMADEVLHSGVRGVTDLMVQPGLINLDFADIRTVMAEMGKAMMGTGEGEGDRRAIMAAEAAISNPLLDDVSMKGAKGVLINITGGLDMTLYEVDEATNRIRDEVDPDANIIFGSTFNPDMNGAIRVSVVATGIESVAGAQPVPTPSVYTNAQATRAVPQQRPPLVTVTSQPLSPPRPLQPAAPVIVPAAEPAAPAAAAESHAEPEPEPPVVQAPPPAETARPTPMRPMMPHVAAVPARPEARTIGAVPPRTIVHPTTPRPAMAPAPRVVETPAPVAAQAAPAAPQAPAPAPEASPRRAGLASSLFHRITTRLVGEDEAARAPSPEAARAELVRAEHARSELSPAEAARAERARTEIARTEPVMRAETPRAQATRPTAQPTLAIDSGRGPARSDDDALDIPAFLRRQAN